MRKKKKETKETKIWYEFLKSNFLKSNLENIGLRKKLLFILEDYKRTLIIDMILTIMMFIAGFILGGIMNPAC
jgi:uncharacterized membrane protein